MADLGLIPDTTYGYLSWALLAWSLGTEPGVGLEHYWTWPQTKIILIIINKRRRLCQYAITKNFHVICCGNRSEQWFSVHVCELSCSTEMAMKKLVINFELIVVFSCCSEYDSRIKCMISASACVYLGCSPGEQEQCSRAWVLDWAAHAQRPTLHAALLCLECYCYQWSLASAQV